ncbi:MAG: Spi family protease inhibitor [Bacteroidaceae bacterium]|nr:Spi family protease inhibitor [Bacteroidaceae bacterium]
MGHPTIKTVLFMLMLAALHPHQASARQVSEEQAAATARMFLSQRGIAGAMHQAPRRASRRVPAPDVDAPYYIFNVGSGEGYVVVSGTATVAHPPRRHRRLWPPSCNTAAQPCRWTTTALARVARRPTT